MLPWGWRHKYFYFLLKNTCTRICEYSLCMSLIRKLRDKWIVMCQEGRRAENGTQLLILRHEFDAESHLNSNCTLQPLSSFSFLPWASSPSPFSWCLTPELLTVCNDRSWYMQEVPIKLLVIASTHIQLQLYDASMTNEFGHPQETWQQWDSRREFTEQGLRKARS